MSLTPLSRYAEALDELYARYNHRRWVHPDPLEVLYEYPGIGDREVVGFIAAVLAYGRVGQILRSVRGVLQVMGPSPRQFLLDTSDALLLRAVVSFKHRFNTGSELGALLVGIRAVLKRYGSLEACFGQGYSPADRTVLAALTAFVGRLGRAAGGPCGHLLADPAKGSSCKRYHLYLRWMVRCDEVDPGGWGQVAPSSLIVPMDTHMHRIGLALGATRRRSADLRAALEVTEAFRGVSPNDPVRYDFALTRLGIHPEADMGRFLTRCGIEGSSKAKKVKNNA